MSLYKFQPHTIPTILHVMEAMTEQSQSLQQMEVDHMTITGYLIHL